MTIQRLVGLLLLLCLNNSLFADQAVGRYITVKAGPLPAQMNLLSQTIHLRFPPSVQTIGDAMKNVLRFSGYSLIEENKQTIELKNTLDKPLPLIDRDFGPMSLKEALSTLAGPAFSLVSDPLTRTVDFKLKGDFIRASKISRQKI